MNPDPDKILDNISKFVYWLAHRMADDKTPLMDFDELVGELFLEIAKGMDRYADKPMNELLAILRKMCDNRVSELKYKYYKTHRIAARFTLSIDVVDVDPVSQDGDIADYSSGACGSSVGMGSFGGKASAGYGWITDTAVDMIAITGSAFRVAETRRRLSPSATIVFDNVILDEDSRVADQIALAGMRAANVYRSGGTVRIKPRHVAAALPGLSESVVKSAFAEIRRVYREVREEYG